MKNVIKMFQDSETSTCIFSDILKAPVNFQKDRPETVGGVTRTKCILPIHFYGIRPRKKSKLKNSKKDKK